MVTDNVSSADNQQEILHDLFYYAGFAAGEMSCSLLRLSNRKSKTGGIYYTPDITISNSDKSLLKEVNKRMANGMGVISPIKGGFNLSIRGKNKVKRVLSFFRNYPPITGDLVLSKLLLMTKAIELLENKRGYRRTLGEQKRLEGIRREFRRLKETAVPISEFAQQTEDTNAIGYFISGVLDAEGSVGIKRSGGRGQPFIAVAMKDKKIVDLFQDFLGYGHIHYRPKEKIHHFEIGSRKEVLITLPLFSEVFPSKLTKMKKRIDKLQEILNDYTPGSSPVW